MQNLLMRREVLAVMSGTEGATPEAPPKEQTF
jgi:hypothetical protein